jgi:transcription antitermination factor NusA-like protein
MKVLPACATCVNSGFLCNNCQDKLDSGVITEFELDLAKDLVKLEEQSKFEFLKDLSFYKAIDYEDVVIMIIGNKDKIHFTPELIAWIKETYEVETLILIEKSKKPRPVIESLIAPLKLKSLNEIFLATGDIEFKAVLQKKEEENLLFTAEELEELVLEITGNVIRVEFE